ncbi:DUF1624 domain-containing protein [Candidatus Micrarchaeota archaeon]|nr:DUF1624 domain-containing protein [Candidatus Micrarchaeota archaeon]
MRFWNIDFLRGIAVIGMVAYNWAYALDYFGFAMPMIHAATGWLFSRTVAFMFVFIAGISFTLIRGDAIARYSKRIDHGKKILFFAFLITIITYLFDSKYTVWFGVLHLIGFSLIIMADFEKRFGNANKFLLPLAPISILLGIWVQSIITYNPFLLMFGVFPVGMATFDYLPVFPWIGYFMLGIFVGEKIFNRRKPSEYNGFGKAAVEKIAFLGRHSLGIYLLHQPVLILTLKVVGAI